MSKILRVEYYPKPQSSVYTFKIYTENLNPETEVVILKISYDFYYPTRIGVNQYEVKVNQSKLSLNSGSGLSNLKIRLFSYAFLDDKNSHVCTGSISLYNSTGPNNPQIKKSILVKASDDAQPWVKDLRVTSIKGPFQDGQIVTSIDLAKPVRYLAYIGGQKYSRAQFLAIKWSYSIDGGGKTRFNYQKEWNYDKTTSSVAVYDDHVVMECNMKKEWEGKKISVYGFFRGESESVKASAKVVSKKSTATQTTSSGKSGGLIWGNKVSDEFEQKVIQICKDLWGESRKIEMANGLMAVMAVETARTFKAHIVAGQNAKTLIPPSSLKKDDFLVIDKEGKKSSKAVGLIQFTQPALESLGDFKRGSGFDKLHEVKLQYARMGEIKQLDKVKAYLYPSSSRIKTPEDIYLQVFAPIGVGKSDTFPLYEYPSLEYKENISLDTNSNKIIERKELLQRYYKLYKEGQKNMDAGSASSTITTPEIAEVEEVEEIVESDGKWHDPVDNPICTLYMQGGNDSDYGKKLGKHWGLFGTTRNGGTHQGLDLFATLGTNIYACVDATVYNIQWHGGYGNIICIKVSNKKDFLARRLDYKLQYANVGEKKQGPSWSENGDIFLFYAHLHTVESFKFGEEVKAGQVLGTTGTSGVGDDGTKAPHLHFEIFSYYTKPSGLTYNINPAFFVEYKGYDEQSDEDKERQESAKDKEKVNEYRGKMDLKKAWMPGFKR